MKEIFEKIKRYSGKIWRRLAGMKRRIAIITLMLSKILPAHTTAFAITKFISEYGEYLFYLFGSADLAESAVKKIKTLFDAKENKND